MNVPDTVVREVARSEPPYQRFPQKDSREKRQREERANLPASAECAADDCRRTISPRYRVGQFGDPFRCNLHSGAA